MTVRTPTRPWRRAEPDAPALEADRTLVDLFFDRVARRPGRPALRHRDGDVCRAITWLEYGAAVREAAAGPVALGIESDDDDAVEAALDGDNGHGTTEVLATHPLVHNEIAQAVDRLNAERAPAEPINAWRILPRELTVAGGELTPTLKVKRAVVIERFGDLVEEMYAR